MQHGRQVTGDGPTIARWGRVAWTVLLGATVAACFTGLPDTPPLDTTDGTGGAMPFLSCEPGEVIPCTCANGASGESACASNGAETTSCVCAPQPDPTAASTTLPPPMMGDSSTGDETASGGDTASSGSDGAFASSDSGDSGDVGSGTDA